MKKKTVEKFHGMVVVSDDDLISVRGKNVVEINSAGKLVCRYYDEEGNAEDDPFELDLNNLVYKDNLKEENVTGAIKRDIGQNSVLISESAIRFIKSLVQ